MEKPEFILSSDPEAYAKHMRTLDPREASYGIAMARLIEAVKAQAVLAEEAPTIPDKVHHLETAKFLLAELEGCVVDGGSIEVAGVAKAKAELAGVEQAYRAFGYYRMAGVA